jgi:hypothetical protein
MHNNILENILHFIEEIKQGVKNKKKARERTKNKGEFDRMDGIRQSQARAMEIRPWKRK